MPFRIYDSHLFHQGNDRSEFLEYHSTHLAVLSVVFDYALKRVGNTACHCERRSRHEDDVLHIGERESGIDSDTRHDEMIGETVAMAPGAPVVGAVREFEYDGALSHASFSVPIRSLHASSPLLLSLLNTNCHL